MPMVLGINYYAVDLPRLAESVPSPVLVVKLSPTSVPVFDLCQSCVGHLLLRLSIHDVKIVKLVV